MVPAGNSEDMVEMNQTICPTKKCGYNAHMKAHQVSQAPGDLDGERRVPRLRAKGNSLNRLNSVIDGESFRPLWIRRFDCLSDQPTEYQINDHLSFQQFISGALAKEIPDANTRWDCGARPQRLVELGFREPSVVTGAFEKLLACFEEPSRQRNRLEEKTVINGGGPTTECAALPVRPRQKYEDARWTHKKDDRHYGSQNHAQADTQSQLIEKDATKAASIHDSQMLPPVVDDPEPTVHSDSSFRSAEEETMLAAYQITSQACDRAYWNRSLSDEEQEKRNWQKSKVRARMKHVFGYRSQTTKGSELRYVGRRRNAPAVGMTNLIDNLAGDIQIVRLLPLQAV